MNNTNKKTVSIEIGTTMFARYADLPNTVSRNLLIMLYNHIEIVRICS